MYKNSLIANSVRFALISGAAAAAFTAPTVIAAEEDKVERIEVTGSRIKRTDLETASPITVFSAADIAASGVSTMEDFIQNIPAINGGAEGSSVNNGSRGFATASLRGLGSGRTLVLINGRRFASGDLNSIPTAYVERVEVLRDGASTIYGSDAIAGVINFITKKDFEGVEFQAQYDQASEGDGEKTLLSLTTGASSDRGNVVLSLQYTERKKILQGDRSFSECPIFERDGEKVCGGSGTIPYGQFFNDNYSGHVKDPETGTVRPFDQAIDGFNYATTSYMVTPQEVFSINGAGRFDLTDTVSTFIEGGFTNRKSDQLMAPEGTFWGPTMPATNPYNPVGEDIFVVRRLRETAGRAFTQDFSDYRMVAGLEGVVFDDFDWDISYNYARFVDARLDEGRVNPDRIDTLLDPALCDADADCPEVWNITEAGTLSEDMINYAFVPNSPIVRGETRQLQANISGGLFGLELQGGEVMFGAGYEKRWEEYSSTPDGAASIGQIYSVAGEATEGQYSVDELYAEMDFPILSGVAFAESLRFTAAIRYSDFDFLDDSSTNTKFGLEWAPIEGLLLRSTLATGFRAPSVSELYSPQSETNLAYNDPCENYGSGSQSATVKANCAAEGLPGNFELSSNQSSTIVGGSEDLQPEESDSLTLGVVYSHDSGFSIGLDYFDIEITNGIGTAGTDNIVSGCWESTAFSSPLCDFIEGPGRTGDAPHATSPYRTALGPVAGVVLTNANLSTFQTSGVDFDISYKTEIGAGDFGAVLNGTYLDKYNYVPFDGAEKVETAGKVAADQWETTLAVFSQWRTNLTLNYVMDDWSVTWQSRYQSEGEDYFASEDNLDNIADAVFYHDIQGTYFVLENTSLTLGIKNLFDQDAPYISNNQDMNTIPASYDTAGQYWYARVNVTF
ncbi:TonB-dependent receptor [Shewanella eurypsychrophilus]|uniref:TonB-dependent receptor n=1 Tax=Shewanella eurypsychrophilus TaxID=2593656 RepID=A0ABX6V683_9GAMM|nr:MULTISPECIES: TonB-dependent receptor [Shewanella]QFU22056.1 TonB-dependent receptor [Shewanella sp. YLB-09]QPG57345.1 TonB-dependent receptor [Shewanella eurypsychrophilus]